MWSGVCNFTLALKEQALQHLSQKSTCQSHSGLVRFEGAVNAFKLDHDEERLKPNNVPIKYVKHLEVKRRTNDYSSSGILFCNVPKYDPRIYPWCLVRQASWLPLILTVGVGLVLDLGLFDFGQ